RRDLRRPAELGREGVSEAHSLQPAREGRPLRGMGAAGPLRGRAACSVQIAPLTITQTLRKRKETHMKTTRITAAAFAFGLALLLSIPALAADGAKKPAIVLVHGAFADGSSWAQVIALLQDKGYNVTAVQNPLTSLADDVATTRRAIARQNGPVILVGHSWGGVVITEAGMDPKIGR